MKVTGFTFIRNAVTYDYPIVEAIQSILPVCTHFVVMVGKSEDETLQLIKDINSPKIKIYESVWDDSLREGGRVLAVETDKAYKMIDNDSDWCFYIQGDEVLHEKFHNPVMQAMHKHKDDKSVDGLLFDYLHFYGSYDFTGNSRRWYRKEIRIVRKDQAIHSFKDAQGFRKDNKKLHVKKIEACMYHYGWVKPPDKQQAKQKTFNKLWHSDAWVTDHVSDTDAFDYSLIDSLAHFKDSHPVVMKKRIDALNWKFDFDPTQQNFSWKNRLLYLLESKTGYRIGEYKNYKKI